MDCAELLIFLCLGFGLTSCSDSYLREYHYVTESLNWTEAQKYCREKSTDLATIESAEDLSRLNRPSEGTYWSWIGLSDDPQSWKGVMNNDSNSWRWSATGTTSETGYQNWGSGNPNKGGGRESCVFMNREGRWGDAPCSITLPFVCYNDTSPPGQRTYSVITDTMTWTEAQKYCRTHHTDLATIENVHENNKVMSTTNVWIGLYRAPWVWSDKSSSSFTNWKIGEPNNYHGNEYCVIMNTEHLFADWICNRETFFWCYDLRVKKTMVRMKIQTFADLSDPATNAQILQQLSERFKTLRSDVALRWVTQPCRQKEEETNEASG